MQQFAKAEFVRGRSRRSLLEQIRRGPPGPPSWAEMSGIRDRDLIPGRRFFPEVHRTERPGRDATRAELDAFFVSFLELGGVRVPQTALEPEIRALCRLLGLRKFIGKARFIAKDIQPERTKKRGTTNRDERTALDDWRKKMKGKRSRLDDEIQAEAEPLRLLRFY